MSTDQDCRACSQSTGCTARKTEEKTAEEIGAGPYLAICAAVIVLASVVFRWFF